MKSQSVRVTNLLAAEILPNMDLGGARRELFLWEVQVGSKHNTLVALEADRGWP